jgi:peptide deformylase
MILPIVEYGDPVLLKKGAVVQEITRKITLLAHDMIETMHDANGVGLAAQQVGYAIQMAVLDVRVSDRPSQMLLGAREVDLDSIMPLVLINPTILKREGEELGSEGCLSFPGITGEILRAATVHVSATSLDQRPLQFVATGLLSRAIQHEIDHLNGILFISRMLPESLETNQSKILSIEKQTLKTLKKKK